MNDFFAAAVRGRPLLSVAAEPRPRGVLSLIIAAREHAHRAGTSFYDAVLFLRAEDHAASFPLCRDRDEWHEH